MGTLFDSTLGAYSSSRRPRAFRSPFARNPRRPAVVASEELAADDVVTDTVVATQEPPPLRAHFWQSLSPEGRQTPHSVVGCRSERFSFDVLVEDGGDVMNILLWVLQVLLAVAFFAHGWLFLTPPPEIAEQMNASLPRWFQIFLGVAEVLAAVGLTLPGLTRILPWLVTWAAGGVMIVTLSATVFHLVRREMSSAAITLVLLAMATFVAYMRHRVLPIGVRRAG
jgi:hypothetical protein